MSGQRVFVTGADGRIGSVLVPELRRNHDVVATDRRPRRGAPTRRLPVNARRRLARALRGVDVVVHLAADSRLDAPWRSVARTNIRGTWTLLEAARAAGVRRVVYASSNAVTAGYEAEEPWASVVAGRYSDSSSFPRISTAFPLRPTGAYAVSKIFGEAACRYYADHLGLSAVCIRIGSFYTDNRPHDRRDFATWLSVNDLVRFVSASINASTDTPFRVFYGVSANTLRLFDTDEGARAVGVEPIDDAETWRDKI